MNDSETRAELEQLRHDVAALLNALVSTFTLLPDGRLKCSRCAKPIDEHRAELCEVAAAMNAPRRPTPPPDASHDGG